MSIRSVYISVLIYFTLSISANLYAADWPSYGGDNGSQKYSALDQITAQNVDNLTVAWSWDSVDNATADANVTGGNAGAVPGAYKVTPIVVDGAMYVPTSFGRVVALDAETGRTRVVSATGKEMGSKGYSLPLMILTCGLWTQLTGNRIPLLGTMAG